MKHSETTDYFTPEHIFDLLIQGAAKAIFGAAIKWAIERTQRVGIASGQQPQPKPAAPSVAPKPARPRPRW